MTIEFARFDMSAPDDMSGLAATLDTIGPVTRLAVLAKVEGTATINDYSRGLALRAMTDCLAAQGVHADTETQIVLSTGCEGIISPGGMLFFERTAGTTRFPGLALGMARSEPLTPQQLLATDHARIAAQVTRAAIRTSGLDAADVALVLMKSPVLTHAAAVSLSPAHRARANSTALSRGVAALGIGLALGEIEDSEINDAAIAGRPDLYARRGMVFSGTETLRCEAIVLGNRPGFALALHCGTIADLIDLDALASVLAPDAVDPLTQVRLMAKSGRIAGAFFKAGARPDGRIRGQRTTLFSSELDSDKHLRAAASGVLGALLGDARTFISGGAEHQAAPGGAVFAALVTE
ncbi:MAG: trzD [Hyphomicrobiales bacterium]|nr:trzD [Hyphomicrobiales bacterium]